MLQEHCTAACIELLADLHFCGDALPCPSLLMVVRDGTYWGLASVNNLNLMPREGELAHGLVRVLLHDLQAAAAAADDTLAALLRLGCHIQ